MPDARAPFSLVLPAKHVLDGQTVYMISGRLAYEMARDLTVYTKGTAGHQKISPAPGMVYLLHGSGICQVPDSTHVRVEFETGEALKDFVDEFVRTPEEDK